MNTHAGTRDFYNTKISVLLFLTLFTYFYKVLQSRQTHGGLCHSTYLEGQHAEENMCNDFPSPFFLTLFCDSVCSYFSVKQWKVLP